MTKNIETCSFLSITYANGFPEKIECTHPNAAHGSAKGLVDGIARLAYQELGEILPESSVVTCNGQFSYYACGPAKTIEFRAILHEQGGETYNVNSELHKACINCPGYVAGLLQVAR